MHGAIPTATLYNHSISTFTFISIKPYEPSSSHISGHTFHWEFWRIRRCYYIPSCLIFVRSISKCKVMQGWDSYWSICFILFPFLFLTTSTFFPIFVCMVQTSQLIHLIYSVWVFILSSRAKSSSLSPQQRW